MTEAEWWACTSPTEMLDHLRGLCSDRKLRLFVCACCRRIWHLVTDERSRRAIEVGELYADGEISDDELLTVWKDAWTYFSSTCGYGSSSGDQAARAACAPAVPKISRFQALIKHEYEIPFRWMQGELRDQSDVLREVFGNPFRSVSVDPQWLAWNDGTIPRLARACYRDRQLPAGLLDPDRFADLADALKEAGCGEVAILEHCRAGAAHVRGCWVIDLLLDKE